MKLMAMGNGSKRNGKLFFYLEVSEWNQISLSWKLGGSLFVYPQKKMEFYIVLYSIFYLIALQILQHYF